MNVYDFDNTIYRGDSSIDFWLFCMRKNPFIIFLIPYQVGMGILYRLKIIDKVGFKEAFFCFLSLVSDLERKVEEFWDKNDWKIKEWYYTHHRENDLVISASPGFLLVVICRRMGVCNLIASEVDISTGKFLSPNCYGTEKIRRFDIEYPGGVIKEFYSDSLSDRPLAVRAKESFLVRGDHITKWEL